MGTLPLAWLTWRGVGGSGEHRSCGHIRRVSPLSRAHALVPESARSVGSPREVWMGETQRTDTRVLYVSTWDKAGGAE